MATCPNLPLQMGLWASLFVLSTLLINAPTVPAVLRFTGLTKARLLRQLAVVLQDCCWCCRLLLPFAAAACLCHARPMAGWSCACTDVYSTCFHAGVSCQVEHSTEGKARAAALHRHRHPGKGSPRSAPAHGQPAAASRALQVHSYQ